MSTRPAPVSDQYVGEPWERQPGETRRMFEWFRTYRNLGPTRTYPEATRLFYSIDEAATTRKTTADGKKITPGKLRYCHELSHRHRWRERAELWDAENRRKEDAALDEERRAMAKRHASIATALQGKIVQKLNGLKPEELSVADLIKAFDVTVKVERLSRGVPTDNVAVTDPDKALTPQERRDRLMALLGIARSEQSPEPESDPGEDVDDYGDTPAEQAAEQVA